MRGSTGVFLASALMVVGSCGGDDAEQRKPTPPGDAIDRMVRAHAASLRQNLSLLRTVMEGIDRASADGVEPPVGAELAAEITAARERYQTLVAEIDAYPEGDRRPTESLDRAATLRTRLASLERELLRLRQLLIR